MTKCPCCENSLKSLSDFPYIKILQFNKHSPKTDVENAKSQDTIDRMVHVINTPQVQAYLYNIDKHLGKTMPSSEIMNLGCQNNSEHVYTAGDDDTFDLYLTEEGNKGTIYLRNNLGIEKINEPIAEFKYEGKTNNLLQTALNFFKK